MSERGERLRLSGAIVLTRPARGAGNSRRDSLGDAHEVYLLERAPTLSFFGGYWALAGGVVEDIDREAGGDEEDVVRRCALRELAEETGVAVGPEQAGELTRMGRVTTPPFARVRYRATYYHLDLPSGAAPRALTGEHTAGEFVTPSRALEEWRRGARRLVPPLVHLFELWSDIGFAALAERFGSSCEAAEAGRLFPARSTPGIGLVPLRTPTVPPATTTNCYLVGEERVWVVDPATYEESERARLDDLLERTLADGRELAGVLVTHHHPDHVGAVAHVSQRFGLEVRAHPLTLDRLPDGFRRGPDLADGAEVALGTAPDGSASWKLTAYHTPGHDRGHLAFLDSRYGALIAGDLVSTLSTIVIDPPEGHLATYLASLQRMADLAAVRTIHPAHGPVHPDAPRLLRGYLEHRRQREQRLIDSLGTQPRTAQELVALVYAGDSPEVFPLAERSLIAGLEKLEEEGRATSSGDGWVSRR